VESDARVSPAGAERRTTPVELFWDGRGIVFTRKTSAGGDKLHFRLAMMTTSGGVAGGAPTHRRGSEEIFPAWQPLP
jgi:hypothetical protein